MPLPTDLIAKGVHSGIPKIYTKISVLGHLWNVLEWLHKSKILRHYEKHTPPWKIHVASWVQVVSSSSSRCYFWFSEILKQWLSQPLLQAFLFLLCYIPFYQARQLWPPHQRYPPFILLHIRFSVPFKCSDHIYYPLSSTWGSSITF